MDFKPNQVLNLIEAMAMVTVSLDSTFESGKDGDEVALEDSISGDPHEVENSVEHKLLAGSLEEMLEKLPETEKRILRLRYGFEDGIPHSLEEVAAIVTVNGVHKSRESIRKIEYRALHHFRIPSAVQRVNDYL